MSAATRLRPLRRFGVRLVASVVVLAILAVGGSTWLVLLARGFLQTQTDAAIEQGVGVGRAVPPLYRDYFEAVAATYRARAQTLAARVDGLGHPPAPPELRRFVADQSDVVAVAWREGDAAVSWPDPAPRETDPEFVVQAATQGRGVSGELVVRFRLDRERHEAHQGLGRSARALEVRRERQPLLEDAVLRAFAISAGAVLLLAVGAGLLLARGTTRRVGVLGSVMAEVARGDLARRVPDQGPDELGELGRAFNRMLDELAAEQAKVAYLQRIGAWQEMARRLAHEIKNPLTPIALAVQQVRDKDPATDPAFSRLLATAAEIVEDEVATLRRLVGDFSQFAKLPEVRPEVVSLARLLEEFERSYGHITDSVDDAMEIVAPDPDIDIRADRQLIKQVLVNLVENAVLSARETPGGVRVRITCRALEAEGWAELVVDDNGPGVPEDQRSAIFEPYVTSRERGTGLGLAIAMKILLDHAGRLEVGSSPLGGARFVMRLPLVAVRR